tara:strand:- start:111 stop:449 length:339 start_codon:yes stop_codon:yes gene_type:complete
MIKKSSVMTTTTALQSLYTVPNGKRTEWKTAWISNISGSHGSFTFTYYNNKTSTTYTIFNAHTLSSKEFFTMGGEQFEFVVMYEGDYIQVSATHPMTAIVSVVEYNDIIQGG